MLQFFAEITLLVNHIVAQIYKKNLNIFCCFRKYQNIKRIKYCIDIEPKKNFAVNLLSLPTLLLLIDRFSITNKHM